MDQGKVKYETPPAPKEPKRLNLTKNESRDPTKLSSPRPSSMLGKLPTIITKLQGHAEGHHPQQNCVQPNQCHHHATKLTKVKPFQLPKEPETLSMDQAKPMLKADLCHDAYNYNEDHNSQPSEED